MNVTAQTEDTRDELQFGIKGGINNSNVWDEEGQDFTADSKNGYVAGVYLSIPIGTYLGIQPELLYAQKGFQGYGRAFGTDYSYVRTTEHIDIPILIQFKPSEYITFLGGPTYSYLTRQTDVRKVGAFTQSEENEFNNDNLRKNTLGAVFGADINISHFVIAPRVGWDFQTNNGDGTSSSPRYRNQWLQLAVGYRF
jgi:hypothetical protein